MQDHRRIDERSLAFGRAIAARLPRYPEHVTHAQATLGRWLNGCSDNVRPALMEWQAILDGTVEGIIEILTATDERAIRLRQSSPFAGILSNQERNGILRAFETQETA